MRWLITLTLMVSGIEILTRQTGRYLFQMSIGCGHRLHPALREHPSQPMLLLSPITHIRNRGATI